MLDRRSPIPLYHQVAEALRQEITARRLRPGDLLTTEEEVERRFGVSRATARRALEELVDEGLVERVTGKGTRIARPKVQVRLPNMLSFTEEILRLGMTPSSRVLSLGTVAPDEDVAGHLELGEGELVARLERVRYADGEPIVYMVDYLPSQLAPPSGEVLEAAHGSLYAFLATRGVEVTEALHIIEARDVPEEVAQHLGVAPGAPALFFRRTTYDREARPVVYEESFCRADLYRYTVRLRRGVVEC